MRKKRKEKQGVGRCHLQPEAGQRIAEAEGAAELGSGPS